MKVNGISVKGPRVVTLHINISEDEAVEFKFRPLSSDDDFEKVMSKPKPPKFIKPGGVEHYNTDDKKYIEQAKRWSEYKFHWELLRSLSATEGLEWENVKMEEPETWKLWEQEVTDNFGKNSLGVFYNKYVEANMITEESMEKARERFLAGRVQRAEVLSFLSSEPQNTESGEPVKDSDSDLQE